MAEEVESSCERLQLSSGRFQFDGHALTLLDDLNTLAFRRRLAIGASQHHYHPVGHLGSAVGTRLKRTGRVVLFVCLRDEEGVALTVAEPVRHSLLDAAILFDHLFEWLRLAPILLQVLFTGDGRRLFAAVDQSTLLLQHLDARRGGGRGGGGGR